MGMAGPPTPLRAYDPATIRDRRSGTISKGIHGSGSSSQNAIPRSPRLRAGSGCTNRGNSGCPTYLRKRPNVTSRTKMLAVVLIQSTYSSGALLPTCCFQYRSERRSSPAMPNSLLIAMGANGMQLLSSGMTSNCASGKTVTRPVSLRGACPSTFPYFERQRTWHRRHRLRNLGQIFSIHRTALCALDDSCCTC